MATTDTASAATMDTPLLPATTTPNEALKDLENMLAATNLGRSSPLASLDTTTSPSSKNASKATDSGYASLSNTPEKTPDPSCADFDSEILLPSRSPFKRKVIKLKVVDMSIPLQTRNRFNDLNELFGKALYHYLASVKIKYSAVSVKLKVLGEDEDTAKPWIVVSCDKAISNQVKRFFNQPRVKSEYQPRGDNPFLPSFDIIVCDRPPRSIASTFLADIYGDCCPNEDTLCGKMIKVDDTEHGRMATMGGIIMVTFMEGRVMLYGMTVGHIIKEERSNESGLDVNEDQDFVDDNMDCFSDERESYELDLALELVPALSEQSFAENYQQLSGCPAQLGMSWPKIGDIVEHSRDRLGDQADLDWALVQLVRPELHLPNLMPKSHQPPTSLSRQLSGSCELTGKECGTKERRPVVLVGGTRGPMQGLLSTSSSFLMLASGQGFVATYDLLLQENDFYPGDCGSWVVDSNTHDIYGHVVASDVFREAYVIPLHTAFAQMREKLAAVSVCLPSQADLFMWRNKQAEVPAKRMPFMPSHEPISKIDVADLHNVSHEGTTRSPLRPAKTPYPVSGSMNSSRSSGVIRQLFSQSARVPWSYARRFLKKTRLSVFLRRTISVNESAAELDEIPLASSLRVVELGAPEVPATSPEFLVYESGLDSGYGSKTSSATSTPRLNLIKNQL